MALARDGGFSVDVPLDNKINNYGAKECDILRTNKFATKIHQGVTISSGVTHQETYVVKAEARPETSDDNGTGTKNITQGGLKNPSLRPHPN